MPQFAILISPSANRVYTRTAPQMIENEISIFAHHLLDGTVGDFEERTIGGVGYLTFHGNAVTQRDLECLSNVSSLYALFAVHGAMLEPIEVRKLDRYDDDLLSILKYAGKTNEQFTKLLLNVAAAAAGSPDRFLDGRFRVFDPMCGRGTTLNQALIYGHDAFGVEIDKRDFEAYSAFIQRWLRSKSVKHRAVTSRVRRDGKAIGRRLHVELAATRDLYKAGELQTLEMVNADTLYSGELYRRQFFDLVVTDAPYGVQHESAGTSRSRNPAQLLESALPIWHDLLRAGGALGLSWNTYVMHRDELAKLVSRAGFEVMATQPYLGFEHRVDQAINRDLIVARKPA